MQLNPELPGGGRFVDFGPPSFQEYVGYSYSDEESEGSMEEGEEGGAEFDDEEQGSDGSFEGGSLEDDEHAHGRIHGHPHQQATYAEESAMQTQDNGAVYPLETEQDMIQRYQGQPAGAHSDDIYNRGYDGQAQEYGHEQAPSAQHQQPLQPTGRVAQAQAQAALGVANGGRPAQYGSSASVQESQQQYFQQSTLARKLSVDERLGAERDMAQAGHHPPGQASSIYSGGTAVSRERTPPGVTSTSRLKAFTEDAGSASPTTSQESETKKISLTPKIARDDSTDSNLSEAGASARSGSQSLQPHQQRQPLRNVSNASSANADVSNVSSTFSGNGSAFGRGTPTQGGDSEDRSHFRRGSAGSAASSVNSGMSANSAQKRGASPASDMSTNAHTKKKKSGGILGGLFSRSKKDKKEEKDKKGSQRKNSESTSDEERVSLNSSPAPESPEREKGRASPSGGLVSQQLQQRRAQQQAQEDMFGNEAARRQQQVEAQSVMYQAYGIHPRGPGDATNSSTFSATITPPASAPEDAQPGGASELAAQRIAATQGQMAVSPSQTSMQSSMSYNHSLTGRQLRPGSLIGSPHMANSGGSGEVPVLNVLRVFAGDNIVADATFKTVLLNESTSTEELVKQAMQRFRLAPPVTTDETISSMDAIMQEYYLTAKESDGEETRLHAGQKPLTVFEKLSQAAGYLNSGRSLPSVKRSSVGSISSISSTLSMNPAIEKLRMSDFSDDSQVKLFINRRSTQSPGGSKRTSDSSSTGTITGRRISDDLQLDANRLSGSHGLDKGHGVSPTSPLMRFAVKILIHPADLPDSMAFDPFSHSLIARSALADREQQASRSPSMSSLNVTSSHRERIMFFPRNANVSEILETALDRFGIVEGVVDGGDEVDSKILKRRSMSRIRYSLAAIRPDSLDQGRSCL